MMASTKMGQANVSTTSADVKVVLLRKAHSASLMMLRFVSLVTVTAIDGYPKTHANNEPSALLMRYHPTTQARLKIAFVKRSDALVMVGAEPQEWHVQIMDLQSV